MGQFIQKRTRFPHLWVLADGEFLTLGLLECIDVSPGATEAGLVECWCGLGVCLWECVWVVLGVVLARALRGPALGVATGLLQSRPSSWRSLALSFLPEAFPAVPVAAVVAEAVTVAAAVGLSSCTSSILCVGLPGVSPRSPHSPWPHYAQKQTKMLSFRITRDGVVYIWF